MNVTPIGSAPGLRRGNEGGERAPLHVQIRLRPGPAPTLRIVGIEAAVDALSEFSRQAAIVGERLAPRIAEIVESLSASRIAGLEG